MLGVGKMGAVLDTCGKLTGGKYDDKLIAGLLKKLVHSGYLHGDLTPLLAQAGLAGQSATIEISELDLEESDADQVEINEKEFYITGVELSGGFTYNGQKYTISLTVDLHKQMTLDYQDIKIAVRELDTDPDLPDSVKDILKPIIGSAFSSKVSQGAQDAKAELKENGELTDSDDEGPASRPQA